MTVSFQLPSTIEEQLRKELVDLDQVAKEAANSHGSERRSCPSSVFG